MSNARGCFKPVLIGCGTLFVISLIFVGISALVAWNTLGDTDEESIEQIAATGQVVDQTAGGRGKVILNLAQGEFEIMRAAPGEGISVEARYDTKIYELSDRLIAEGGQWEYRLDFRRTMPALQAMFRSLMVKSGDTYFRIYLPVNVELDLEIFGEQGGLVCEFGGLWLNEADIHCKQGGFVLNFDRPLKAPMDRLTLQGAMGGFNLSNLGNASPALLDIQHRMGGANIDLRGQWSQDCDIRIGVRMGGTSVSVPRDVAVEGAPISPTGLRQDSPEVPPITLRFSLSESMGEIDFSRR